MLTQQQGFSLIELMVVITIIAILSAIAIPSYQHYLQKATLTHVLQTAMNYKTAVELCAMEDNALTDCNNNQHNIPASLTNHYLSQVQVQQGVISLQGQQALKALTVTLTPSWHNEGLVWQSQCQVGEKQQSLLTACQQLFRFTNQTQ